MRNFQIVAGKMVLVVGLLTTAQVAHADGCLVNGVLQTTNPVSGTKLADNIDCSGSLHAVTIDGGFGGDLIIGSDYDDVVNGGAGDDDIYAGSGADTVNGGLGDDDIYGGDGNDVLAGGQGNDDLDGDVGGQDTCVGGAGNNGTAKVPPKGPHPDIDSYVNCEVMTP